MTESLSTPLLRSKSHQSVSSKASKERVPLLSQTDGNLSYDGVINEDEENEELTSTARSLSTSVHNRGDIKKGSFRWPTTAAIVLLGFLTVTIMLGVFITPAVIKAYASQALFVEPSQLSIDSFTDSGVTARVQLSVRMDASRVSNKFVRNTGRFGTWIVKEIESQESNIDIYLPEYGNIFVGTVTIPRIIVGIRNGHTTALDCAVNLALGDVDGIKSFVNDFLKGHLDQIKVLGKVDVSLKSGLLSLGTKSISKSVNFQVQAENCENWEHIPVNISPHLNGSIHFSIHLFMGIANKQPGGGILALPRYIITNLNFREVHFSSGGRHAIATNISASVENMNPVELEIPALAFEISVPSCDGDALISVQNIVTNSIHVLPYQTVTIESGGLVQGLPNLLLQPCPEHDTSSLETLLDDYVHGKNVTVFVRGSKNSAGNIPKWISKIASSITLPVSVPAHTPENLIKKFSITDTQFSLPDIFAQPGSDEADPHISGHIEVIAGLPKEINFGFNVSQVRASSQVFYKTKKLGDLNIHQWQPAESRRLEREDGSGYDIMVQTAVQGARLTITDQNVFGDLVKALLLKEKAVMLKIEAVVDVKVSTILGEFLIKQLPAEGSVPVIGSL